MTNEEHFVLDTQLFVYDAVRALTSFKPKPGVEKKNFVWLTPHVLFELDKIKTFDDETGYKAREALRQIKDITKSGSLKDGVERDGIVYKIFNEPQRNLQTFEGMITNTDNYLIQAALKLKDEGKNVTLVTQDTTPFIIGNSLGLNVEDWKDVKSINSLDELYKGWEKIKVREGEYHFLSKYGKNQITIDDFVTDIKAEKVYPNQYFFVSTEEHPERKQIFFINPVTGYVDNITNYKAELKSLDLTSLKDFSSEQLIAMHALHNPYIHNVFLIGRAGTGKTILALDAGYNLTYSEGDRGNQQYSKILITRPIVKSGEDLGFLPGDMNAKAAPWMRPILDNLSQVVNDAPEFARLTKDISSYNSPIEIQLLSEVRGRSIMESYWIIDESQNTTPSQMKLMGTRPGNGTKVVITGDPDPAQIDLKCVNSSSNGLVHYNEKFKDSPLTATIVMTKVKRSPLAELYANS